MAFNWKIVNFGTKSYCITNSHWDTESQTAIVHFEDDDGAMFSTYCFGMAPDEQRKAVVDELVDHWRQRTNKFVYIEEEGRDIPLPD